MSLPQRISQLTPAEYLRIEREARTEATLQRGNVRHGRRLTCAIALSRLIWWENSRSRLKGRSCTAYDSDLRIRTGMGLYNIGRQCFLRRTAGGREGSTHGP